MMVTVKVPVPPLELVVIVRVEFALELVGGATELGLKLAVDLPGKPLALRLTELAKPLSDPTVMV